MNLARLRPRHITLIWDRRDRELSPNQQAHKVALLGALSSTRQGKMRFEEALKHNGLHPRQVAKKTDAVKIRNGKLVAKVRDRIPRSLKIYEKGKLVHVEVANSEVASDIGKYWSAIGKLSETGKSKALRSLHRQRFMDIHGRIHTLEKDAKIILELESRIPKRESFTIYRS